MSEPGMGLPRPVMGEDTEFFWAATARGELVFQRCGDCGARRHPPGPMCPSCHSFDWAEEVAPASGTVYTFTAHRHPLLPGMRDPHVLAVVEFEGGVRFVADFEGESIDIGDPVRVLFREPGADGIVLPYFVPAGS